MDQAEDIFVVRNNNKLLTWIIVLAFVAILVTMFVCHPKKMKVQLGYLTYRKEFYVTIGSRVFPHTIENSSLYLTLTKDKQNRICFYQEYVTKRLFVLKFECNGLLYAICNGSPGYGAPENIVHASPLLECSDFATFDSHYINQNSKQCLQYVGTIFVWDNPPCFLSFHEAKHLKK